MGYFIKIKKDADLSKSSIIGKGKVFVISGCHDDQYSADCRDVAEFKLPDPAGRAGGACTSVLLNTLYADHKDSLADMSYVEVLTKIREELEEKGFDQIPQLTSTTPIDVKEKFDIVPEHSKGRRRALLIGINYVGDWGELDGCHNDVLNMIPFLKEVHGFDDFQILMDDGVHISPTKNNILACYRKIIADSEPGDAIFLHYSGHGASIADADGDEEDGMDEALVPLDFEESGLIHDDDLFETLIRPLKKDVCMTALMDCCHAGTVLDLPFAFKADGDHEEMEISPTFNVEAFTTKFGLSPSDLEFEV